MAEYSPQALSGAGYHIEYHGMERSGHHALLYWLHRPLPDPSVHIARAQHADQYKRCRWFFEPSDTPSVATISYGRDVGLQSYTRIVEPDLIIVMVRDLRNLMASRMQRMGVGHELCALSKKDLWLEYAGQVAGTEDYFPGKNVIGINYNRWFVGRKYRQDIIDQINQVLGTSYPFTDADLQRVSRIGGGSSFDGNNYDGQAQKMKVLERWKKFKDHPHAKRFRSPEIDELSNVLFPKLYSRD